MTVVLQESGLLLGALATGVVSALVPLINAEVVALTVAATSSTSWAIAVAIALAVGQTVGKLTVLEAARRGSAWRHRSRRGTSPPSSGRWHAATTRVVDLLGCRWRGAGVVLVSATIGLPPLALVSAGCGIARMRRRDFAVCCLSGRGARFLALTLPVAALGP